MKLNKNKATAFKIKSERKLSDIVDSDPFSVETDRKRRGLILISSLCILTKVYGVEIKNIPWLEFSAPAAAPNLLEGALSVILIYMFFYYLISAWVDFRRWHYASDIVNLNGYFELVQQVKNNTEFIDLKLRTPNSLANDEQKYIEQHFEFFEVLHSVCALHPEIVRLQKKQRKLLNVQLIKVFILEFGAAFVIGAFAISKMGYAFYPFLMVLFQ